ncbi:hypothetical protein QYE76_008042 [Lolium multiflorum]|uniref:Uncharacterized protein n=1 Tax=Lolium multiflorum TaxID=4521 RepID=A0AAD8QKL0_LOLMU|nr:hypothetical protein QYE76_008042 [Lolium multiflorum]
MGRKNRKPLANPTPLPQAAGAGAGDVAAMRADWDKALTYLQRGNQAKALRLIREALARHGQGSPLLLRALGIVHSRAAAVTNDPSARATTGTRSRPRAAPWSSLRTPSSSPTSAPCCSTNVTSPEFQNKTNEFH